MRNEGWSSHRQHESTDPRRAAKADRHDLRTRLLHHRQPHRVHKSANMCNLSRPTHDVFAPGVVAAGREGARQSTE